MRAVGYIRVYTEEEAREGVSLDNQRKRIKACCSRLRLSYQHNEGREGVSRQRYEAVGGHRAHCKGGVKG